ncbi:MAG TPA: hypothetical protein ENJ95_02215 [Bacteroidetes bacterium]|nr:hypothetical protein [Bacteroidota bacterium]
MTIQLNFDKNNQQRLIKLVEWLQDLGIIKSYKLADAQNRLEYFIAKDRSGTLSRLLPNELENIVQKAKQRLADSNVKNSDGMLCVVLAALLYDAEIFSAGQAAAFAGMAKSDFIRQLGKFKVSSFGETPADISAL